MTINFICTKTRECRANNFLGMSYGPAYDGMDLSKGVPNRLNHRFIPGVDDEVGDLLVIFQTFQDGMNAALWRLKEVYFDHGINTPELIYNKWSGDTQTQATEKKRPLKGVLVANMMGVAPTTILTWGFNDLKDLLHAMLRFEDTTAIFESDLIKIPDAMYLEAIAYAVHKTDIAVPVNTGLILKESHMAIAGTPLSAQVTPWYKQPETQKDIVTLAGVATDALNLWGHFLPPGIATAVGVGLRAVINLFSGGNPS